jgi:ketosteroid isomerase-like protein
MSNKDVVRRFYQAVDNRDSENISQLCTRSATFHIGNAPVANLEEFVRQIAGMPLGDWRHVIRDLIADGDKVACHVEAIQGTETGQSVMAAISLFTLVDGKIANELLFMNARS